MERFFAARGRLPAWAKVRVKLPRRMTLIREGAGPFWLMIRPELDVQQDNETVDLRTTRTNYSLS